MWAATLVLLGAVVGGAASSLGSYVVARGTARRGARATILNEILPIVIEESDHGTSHNMTLLWTTCLRLYKAAAVAGRRDLKRAREIQIAAKAIKAGSTYFEGVTGQRPASHTPAVLERFLKDRQKNLDVIADKAYLYDEWLTKRFGGDDA